MAKLESQTTIKDLRKVDTDKSSMRTKIWAAFTLLGISGLITLSYMNENVFMEHIAICGFIISCIAIIKIMETH